MAAENRGDGDALEAGGRCFNEAAANGRGKQRRPGHAVPGAGLASMRPRRMAAENITW